MLFTRFNLAWLPHALRASREQGNPQPVLAGSLMIRRSERDDARALRQLAALDSRPLPAGAFLLAEIGEEIVAAAPLSGAAEPFANPFKPTTDIRDLLVARARQLQQATPLGAAA